MKLWEQVRMRGLGRRLSGHRQKTWLGTKPPSPWEARHDSVCFWSQCSAAGGRKEDAKSQEVHWPSSLATVSQQGNSVTSTSGGPLTPQRGERNRGGEGEKRGEVRKREEKPIFGLARWFPLSLRSSIPGNWPPQAVCRPPHSCHCACTHACTYVQ